MKFIKSVIVAVLLFATVLSLAACGVKAELKSAEGALKRNPYRVSSKTSFRSGDLECAVMLSALGGTALPLIIDGDRVQVSAVTQEGIRLTLCVIGKTLYYVGELEDGTVKLLVKLSAQQEKELKEQYGAAKRVSYESYATVEKSEELGDEVYICKGINDEAKALFKKSIELTVSDVFTDELDVLDAEMSVRLSDGLFKYVTTTVHFTLYLNGKWVEASMVTEESYIYSDSYRVTKPSDEIYYEEVDYSDIFG